MQDTYLIMHLNLKGLINVEIALDRFSWDYLESVYDTDNFSCVYGKLLLCPAIEHS